MTYITDNQSIEGLLDTKSLRTVANVVATANTTTTYTLTQEQLNIYTGSTAGQIIKLTDATTISIGHWYEIHNNSTQTITINDNALSLIHALLANERIELRLQVAGTAAGTWSKIVQKNTTSTTVSNGTFNDMAYDALHAHSGLQQNDVGNATTSIDTAPIDLTAYGTVTQSIGTTFENPPVSKANLIDTSNYLIFAAGLTIEWRLRINSNLSDTNNGRFNVKAGIQSSNAIGNPASGVYFEYSDNINSGAWNCVSRNSSTSTTLNSSVTVAVDTWYRLKFIINTSGTNIDFYIATGTGDFNFIGSITTNIPVANATRLQVSLEKQTYHTNTFSPANVNTGTEVITITSHGYNNNDRVMFTSSGTLPSPLATGTTYYIVGATTNTFQVSTTSGGSAVNLTSTGSGTHTINEVANLDRTITMDWYNIEVSR